MMIINKLDALQSTVNIDPKTHLNFSLNRFTPSSSSPSHRLPNDHSVHDLVDSSHQPTQSNSISLDLPHQPRIDLHDKTNQSIDHWNMTDRLRLWRDDARAQHLYQTAAFWGAKVYNLTSEPNDAFWLAQVYFLTGQFFRAEKILTAAKRFNGRFLAQDDACLGLPRDRLDSRTLHSAPDIDSTHLQLRGIGSSAMQGNNDSSELIRMTDYSTACRYLAAQCMIRQGKWEEALEMVGEENPFRIHQTHPHQTAAPVHSPLSSDQAPGGSTKNPKQTRDSNLHQESNQAAMDGGIKFESSMCYLRGLIHLQNKALDRAKDCFLESLALDVKCYESFEALVGGNMLEPEEEWEFVQSLGFHHQTPEDQLFIKSLYTVRLKKFNHKDEVFESFRCLKERFNLHDDPDGSFGLADWLFTNYRFQDCYRITSRILTLHDHHQPTLPLHLTCMAMNPNLLPSLFLLSHQLIERDTTSAISWFGAGLWYFSQKRYEESRRFFSKSALLDSRFCPAWFAFGHALAYEGEHDQAITAYSTASHNFQGSHLPLLFIGMQYIQLANLTLAFDYLNSAFEICRSDPLVLHEKGVVLYYQEKWEDAIEAFEESLKLSNLSQTDPKVWCSSYLNLSHCYRRLRRYKQALEMGLKARTLQPRSATVLTATGMAYHGLGNNSSAIRFYHESLAIVPADPMTTSLLKFSLDLEITTKLFSDDEELNEDGIEGQWVVGRSSPEVSQKLIGNLPTKTLEEWKGQLSKFEEMMDGHPLSPAAATTTGGFTHHGSSQAHLEGRTTGHDQMDE